MPFSLQTMTNVVQELKTIGLVDEVEEPRPGRRGSPHRGLSIAAGRCHVLGLQMRWNACEAAVVDLGLSVTARRSLPLSVDPVDAPGYFAALEVAIERLLAETVVEVWAIGLSAPLPIHAPGGAVPAMATDASGSSWDDQRWFRAFWTAFGIEDVRLRLERRFGLPVLIQNNPQSATIAEAMAMALPLQARLILSLRRPRPRPRLRRHRRRA